jgi:ADP-ribose pyrophosphatase
MPPDAGPDRGGPGRAKPEETTEVFAGPLFRVEIQRWADPDRRREVVRHPGSAAVLAFDPDGRVVLVRQLREPVGESLVEVPAGIFDREGESPEQLAGRELHEETGYRATRVERLGTVYTSPGFTDEAVQIFVADARPDGGPEEGIEVLTMTLDEALQAVLDGRIRDAKSVAAIFLARERPNRR